MHAPESVEQGREKCKSPGGFAASGNMRHSMDSTV